VELAWSPRMLRAFSRGAGFDSLERVASGLGWAAKHSGRLLIVGTPTYEPWHLAAHWQDSARWSISRPTLLRHAAPPNAPTHLRTGLDALARVVRTDVVLLIAPDDPGDELLERLSGARHRGTTILALAQSSHGSIARHLDSIAHDTAAVQLAQFDLAQHYLPPAVG
jgi:hypothetical protein